MLKVTLFTVCVCSVTLYHFTSVVLHADQCIAPPLLLTHAGQEQVVPLASKPKLAQGDYRKVLKTLIKVNI